nr:hypothetical protein CFP56_67817 [Quercus suber]
MSLSLLVVSVDAGTCHSANGRANRHRHLPYLLSAFRRSSVSLGDVPFRRPHRFLAPPFSLMRSLVYYKGPRHKDIHTLDVKMLFGSGSQTKLSLLVRDRSRTFSFISPAHTRTPTYTFCHALWTNTKFTFPFGHTLIEGQRFHGVTQLWLLSSR